MGHRGLDLESARAARGPSGLQAFEVGRKGGVNSVVGEAKARHVLGLVAGAQAVTDPVELRDALR